MPLLPPFVSRYLNRWKNRDSPSLQTKPTRQARGKQGEDKALLFLQKEGLRLIARNYRCRWGEIDIIMQDKDTYVFVEVRSRSPSLLTAADSIDASKQDKIIRTAEHYLTTHLDGKDVFCRFDCIHIEWAPSPHHQKTNSGILSSLPAELATDIPIRSMEWIKDAFSAESE